ncbi:MAG TPA: hypothetical protein ENJ95_10615 [Bacteroidetes bacterium]|nr:hypothetical protein [Bacteroidota bacterium]
MIARLTKLTMTAAVLAALLVSPACAILQGTSGQENFDPHVDQSIFDQISGKDMVDITLVTELDSIITVRNSKTYRPAKLVYKDKNGIAHNYHLKVRPRGKFRRRVCDFPPLKLKFSKDELEAAGLNKHNDLKLVSHCLDDEAYNRSLVLREYLAYKLYNQLTPNSFRVQLVRIKYVDKHNKKNKRTHLGFLIEDVDELAERMGGKECDDCFALSEDLINVPQERIASMFEYLIGNTDWSIKMNRNVKLIKMENGKHVPVPYDFDYSVFVGAPYMRPNSDVGQTGSMERIFMGGAKNADELYSTISYFKTKKEALLKTIRRFQFLEEEDRNAAQLYVESFFEKLDSRGSAANAIFKKNEVSGIR